MEVSAKNHNLTNGAKLLSVIDRLSWQNGTKLTQQGNGNTIKDVTSGSLRKRRKTVVNRIDNLHSTEESESLQNMDSRSQTDNSGKCLTKLGGKRLGGFSGVYTKAKENSYLSGLTNTGGLLPIPADVKLTIKPGIPKGSKPSLCFCKPPTKRWSYGIRKHETYIPGFDDIFHAPVVQHAACSTSNKDLNDKEKAPDNGEQSKTDTISQEKGENIEEPLKKKEQQKQNRATKRPSICGICLQKCSSALSLEKHRKENGHYLCSECGEAMQDEVTFREHTNKKLCKKILCSFCGQKFVTRDEVEHHKEKVHHKCLECNKLYKTEEKLLAHNERHHSAPYVCSKCGEEFPTRALCKRHAMSRHSTKKYYCPECGKGFARLNILNRHTTYTHSDARNFKCEVCSKTFKRKDALKIHMISHSDNKPFHCENCGKQFNQKICFTKHLPCKVGSKYSKSKNIATMTDALMENVDKLSENNLENGKSSDGSELNEDNLLEILENGSLESSNGENESVQNAVNDIFLGCRCPTTCACKTFSIGLTTEKPAKGSLDAVEEVASLSCCCDVGLDVTISD